MHKNQGVVLFFVLRSKVCQRIGSVELLFLEVHFGSELQEMRYSAQASSTTTKFAT